MPGPVAELSTARTDPEPLTAPLLVVVAIEFEARRLARRGDTLVRTVGLGARDLPRLTPSWLALRPAAVLVTGLAGGCAPDVESGDLVVGTVVGPTAGGGWLAPDGALAARAQRALEVARLTYRAGPILTVPAIVATPEAKADCWRAHGAVAVDMESAHVLDWAARAGLPALAVRAVADGPADRLPADLVRAVGSGGRVRWTAALGWAGRPALVADAARLWRRSHRALGRLARFLEAFSRAEPDRV